jgi:hypothetical protein
MAVEGAIQRHRGTERLTGCFGSPQKAAESSSAPDHSRRERRNYGPTTYSARLFQHLIFVLQNSNTPHYHTEYSEQLAFRHAAERTGSISKR